MKNKKIFGIIILLLLLIPFNIKALSADTRLIGVNETYSFKSYDYNFTDVKFVIDRYGIINVSFNVSGLKSKLYTINYLFFYDSNKKLIGEYTNGSEIKEGYNNFGTRFPLKQGYSPENVAYYRLAFSSDHRGNFAKQYHDDYDSLEYYISNYDVNIKVNNDNSYDVVEKISAHFNVLKHGIIRNIPLYVDRKEEKVARLSKVKINEKFEKRIYGNYYNLKIGDKNRTFTGDYDYEISYKYRLGDDLYEDKDLLFYNIIGDSWDTVIKKVNFKIDMPKGFDSSKLQFAYGYDGANKTENLKYSIDGNSIVGTLEEQLYMNQALTVRLELPEGYFVKEKSHDIYALILIIVLTIISVILWIIFGFNRIVETVEFYPPGDINSFDLAFLYRGKVRSKDVTSLLIYLANKGYLSIREIDGNNFEVIKLKEYDGNNLDEKIFFDGLFRKDLVNNINGYEAVSSTDLYDNFYIVMLGLINNMNSKEQKDKIIEKNKPVSIIMILFAVAIFVLISILPILGFGMVHKDAGSLYTVLGVSLIFTIVGLVALADSSVPIVYKVVPLLVGIGVYIFGMIDFFQYDFRNNNMLLIIFFTGILSIFIIIGCYIFLFRRNKYGADMLGRIKGFKNFLETAEKDKLNEMVNANPNYFFDILPYTYVLDISDKWVSKFETINMSAPNWYSANSFDFNNFNKFIDRSFSSVDRSYDYNRMKDAREARAYESSFGSGSSFGGGSSSSGGFSGGGSGGGGGSSW